MGLTKVKHFSPSHINYHIDQIYCELTFSLYFSVATGKSTATHACPHPRPSLHPFCSCLSPQSGSPSWEAQVSPGTWLPAPEPYSGVWKCPSMSSWPIMKAGYHFAKTHHRSACCPHIWKAVWLDENAKRPIRGQRINQSTNHGAEKHLSASTLNRHFYQMAPPKIWTIHEDSLILTDLPISACGAIFSEIHFSICKYQSCSEQ